MVGLCASAPAGLPQRLCTLIHMAMLYSRSLLVRLACRILAVANWNGLVLIMWHQRSVHAVNGWSFVKNSKRYYDDTAGIMRRWGWCG